MNKFCRNIFRKTKDIVPLPLRKKLKSYVGQLLTPAIQAIPSEIIREWKHHSSDMPDILDFSVISWDFRFQRPQHLSVELGKVGHRVFYIEHEFIPYNHPNQPFAPIQVKKVADNVYRITISASRELFIYQESPSDNDKKIILASIKNLINQASITNPVAKIDHPFWSSIADQLSMPIVYDCMDNHSGFPESGSNIPELEKKLVQKSDINIVSSTYLQKHISKLNGRNIRVVKNAADWQHFAKKSDIPPEMANLSHPIIGYHGGISNWFDTSILESSLQEFPSSSFVLIGKVENQEINRLANRYPNLQLLGEIPYAQVNQYVSHFDLAIIPFKINDLIKAVNPVKIFEYFACGLPVVSTPIPELLEYNQDLYIADQKNFNQQIKNALSEKKNNHRLGIAKNNTWPVRAQEVSKIITQYLFPKVSVIILSYNHPDLMEKTLDSVIKKSLYPNLEIIVVDNNSNQETKNLLKKYSNIKLILNKENYGFAKGNNIGLKAATGNYLVLLNNDVIVTPGWISRLIFYTRDQKVGLTGPVTNSIANEALIHIEYNPDTSSDLESTSRNYTSSNWGNTLEVNNIAAFCLMMSRQAYQKVGDLDEIFGRGMFEDDDYCFRVKKLGLKILIARDVFIHHFGGASFNPLPEYKQLFEDNKRKFENKWGIKWQPHKQG